MNRVVTNFRLSDANLVAKADVILSQMTNNAHFATPIPTLKEITSVKNAFENALPAAETGDREAIAVKNQQKETLVGLLKRLGTYVDLVANGNKAVMLSSGFDLAKEPEPIGELPKPDGIRIVDGNNTGELQVSTRSVTGSRSYLFQYTLEPASPASVWNSVPSTKTKVLLKGLESGKRYWCRVAGVGSGSNLNFSDAVSRIVQ